MFDELTGNYFGDATAEKQVKLPISEDDRISDGSTSCVEESDGSNGADLD